MIIWSLFFCVVANMVAYAVAADIEIPIGFVARNLTIHCLIA